MKIIHSAFVYLWHSYVPPVFAILAQAVNPMTDTWTPLINIGAIGCVLAWFLFRSEPRMARVERAIDRGTRGNLLAAVAMSDMAEGRTISPAMRAQAKELIKEIDDAVNGK